MVSLPPHHLMFGDSALLVELDDLSQVLGLDRGLRTGRPRWVSDVIPAARTVLVRFDRDRATMQQVSSWVASVDPAAGAGARSPAAAVPAIREIPVRYDGEDLAAVAELTGLGIDEVIAEHTAGQYTVAFCGFAPGFSYLAGVAAAIQVPRRASPRTTVPAGAVGLADEFTAVYPRASPGGWQLIGSTTIPVFDVDRDPPTLLAPGDLVRFVELC